MSVEAGVKISHGLDDEGGEEGKAQQVMRLATIVSPIGCPPAGVNVVKVDEVTPSTEGIVDSIELEASAILHSVDSSCALSNSSTLGVPPPPVPAITIKRSALLAAMDNFAKRNRVRGITGLGVVYLGRIPASRSRLSTVGSEQKSNITFGDMVEVVVFTERAKAHIIDMGIVAFKSNVRLLMTLSHPNVATLRGYCDDFRMNPALIYNWDYSQGGATSLASRLACDGGTAALKWKQRTHIAIDIACAIDYIHKHAKKPHGDLGVAAIYLDNASPQNKKGVDVKLRGCCIRSAMTKENDDLAQDIHSFGVVLLQLITGKKPEEVITQLSPLSASEVGPGDLGKVGRSFLPNTEILLNIVDPKAGLWPDAQALSIMHLIFEMVKHDLKQRPTSSDVLQRLREVPNISGASPLDKDMPYPDEPLPLKSHESTKGRFTFNREPGNESAKHAPDQEVPIKQLRPRSACDLRAVVKGISFQQGDFDF